jgi:hypothetical protein
LAETEEHFMTKPKDSAKDRKLIKAKLCLASKWSYLGKQKLKTTSLDKLQILMKKKGKWSTASKRKNERPETHNYGTTKSAAI